MRAGRIALAVALLAATPGGAQEVVPDPALEAFVAAYNAEDPAVLAEVVDARFGPDAVAQYGGPEGTVGRFLHLRRAYGPVSPRRLDSMMTPPVLWTRAAEVDGWIGFQPRVNSESERWRGLTIWRIRPPGTPARPPVPIDAAADSLHAFLERNAEAGRFAGTVLVARGDSVHFHRSYGVADRETGEPVTPAHRSNIGSVGKMFTAAAALRLVDEGAISLDDPLSKHVPEYPRAIGDAVTVRDLLTHASGIELDDVPGFGEALRTAATPEEILDVHLRYIDEALVEYERTGEFDYTNEGYSLLGLIVERAGGLPWHEALERHVFGPAGMTSTTFSAPAGAPVAVGYTAIAEGGGFDPGPARPAWPMIKPRAHPAGQHWSTAEDLWRFWRALGDGRLLRPETARAMVSPRIDSGGLDHFDLTTAYGHGIQIETREGRTHVGHGGVVPGYSAAVRHFPESDWTIVVTSNAEDTAAHAVAERAEAVLMGRGPADLAARLDAYFQPLAAAGEFGGVVLVGDADSIRALRTYGKADHEMDVPIGPDTRFRIASLTKTFTAGAILVLADRGALTLDDPLARWLPGFPRAERITLRQLLRHESGVGEPEPTAAHDPALDLTALADRIAAAPPRFEPGAENSYSNAGYVLLARVVERAAGVPFDEFLRDTFFEPLGMTRTGGYGDREVVEGRAEGYVPGPPPAGVAHAPEPDARTAIGSGHLWSTASDLWRWARAVDAETLYDAESGDWPYGWGRIRDAGRIGIGQTGLTDGFTASLSVHRETGTYVVVLGNVMNTEWTRWSGDASRIAFGDPVDPPEPPGPPTAIPAEALRSLTGTYHPAAEGPPPIQVVLRDGHLWLHWQGARIGQYLMPLGGLEFAVRGECGTAEFETAGDSTRLMWRCGDGATEFVRSD